MGKLFDKFMYTNECLVEWKQGVAKPIRVAMAPQGRCQLKRSKSKSYMP